MEKEEVNGSTDGGTEDDGENEKKEKRGVGTAAGGDDDSRALWEVARAAFFGRFGGFGGGLAIIDVLAGEFVATISVKWGDSIGAAGRGVGEGTLLDVDGFEEEW